MCSGGMTDISIVAHSKDINNESTIIPEKCSSASTGGTCTFEFVLPCSENECLQTENVEAFTEVATYAAAYMVNVPISIVSIWILDCDKAVFDPAVDNAEVPLCCEASGDFTCAAVQYTFKLECVNSCRSDDDDPIARRLSKEQVEAGSAEVFTVAALNESRPGVNEPRGDAQDGHFCVSEDYPCGEESDRVFVCHYSARDGYKTFCVPEVDSDVLAFYPKDYCGSCIGGYGEGETYSVGLQKINFIEK
jgi:hypothetical protein